MKISLYSMFALVALSLGFSFAEDQPTLAPVNQPNAAATVDNNKSILNHGAEIPAPAVVEPAVIPAVITDTQSGKCCDSLDKRIIYKNKRNIAPCAVPQTVCISFCEAEVDACCKKTCHLEKVDVSICVPPCLCTETVTVSREGRKVVYDYGRYEVVLKARRDGIIEVDYRKRLLDR